MKVLTVVESLNNRGIANVVLSFYRACRNMDSSLVMDFVTYSEVNPSIYDELNSYGSKVFVIDSVSHGIKKYYHNIQNIIISNGPYHAVHAHNSHFIWLVCKAAKSKNIGIRIGHAHGAYAQRTDKRLVLFSYLSRILNRRYCTKMLSCSEKSGEWTFGKGFEFLPNIVEYTDYDPEYDIEKYYEEFDLDKNQFILGYVGGFTDEKNTLFLLDILKKAPEDYVCVMAGNGSCYDEFISKMKLNKSEDKFRLLGYRNDVQNFMPIFNVLLCPSLSEGMSGTLLQSQIAGVETVVSNGVPITNNLGFGIYHVVKDYNPDNWIESIEECRVKREQLNYKQRISKLKEIGYDKESVSARLIECYSHK